MVLPERRSVLNLAQVGWHAVLAFTGEQWLQIHLVAVIDVIFAIVGPWRGTLLFLADELVDAGRIAVGETLPLVLLVVVHLLTALF